MPACELAAQSGRNDLGLLIDTVYSLWYQRGGGGLVRGVAQDSDAMTLQELIRESSLKQREVAERSGLSAQYLCDIVRGRTLPPPWTVDAIARVLNLPSEEVKQAITAQYLLAMLCRDRDQPEKSEPPEAEEADDAKAGSRSTAG
jgi:transcriptional regulator with XRE-family HTH domain